MRRTHVKQHYPIITVLSVCLLASLGAAVMPAVWEHGTEADFSGGEKENLVVNSYGEIVLTRKVDVLVGSQDAPQVISAFVGDGKTCYAASGTDGKILRVRNGKAEAFADLPCTMVTAMATSGKGILAGGGGENAGLYRIDAAGKVEKVWSHESVKYVWAILPAAGGKTYLATGNTGAVWRIDRDGNGEKVYQLDKLVKNMLCLALDEKKGTLFVGTDTEGLVVAIDVKTGRGRVIFDAPEQEISALVLGPKGGVYAATADASKAVGDGSVPPSGQKTGKSEGVGSEPNAPSGQQAPAGQDEPRQDGEDQGDVRLRPDSSEARRNGTSGKSDKLALARAVRKARGMQESPELPEDMPPEMKEQIREVMETIEVLEAEGSAEETESGQAEPAQEVSGPSEPFSGGMSEPSPAAPTSAGQASGEGNTIYFIRPTGIVEPIFRRPVAILAMAYRPDDNGGKLLIGTGNGGAVYSVSIDGDEIVQLVQTEAGQVTGLILEKDSLLFATANKGSIARLSEDLAEKGTYVSGVQDAGQIATWGTVRVRAEVPKGAKATVSLRSGNVSEPDENTWSDWSKEIPVDGDYAKIGAPAGRYLQYRLTLHAGKKVSPVVRNVRIIHQLGNLAPTVSAVAVQVSPGNGGPAGLRNLQITAADQNGDGLTYSVYFREKGGKKWVLAAEELAEPAYVWDTTTVNDGVYELRAVATDEASNPPGKGLTAARVTDPIVVDNTAPQVKEIVARPDGKVVRVSGQAVDRLSRIVRIEYSVDSASKWRAVLPTDEICDDTSEKFAFDLEDLDAGPHRIAVRVTDEMGNAAYGSVNVTVGK